MERTAAMALMNKSIMMAKVGQPLEILTATASDNVENFIFVESYRRNSVVEAIQDLNFCFSRVEMLSLDEMPKLYQRHKLK